MWKKIFFIAKLLRKGFKSTVQAVLIQFVIELLLRLITKELIKKDIDLVKIQDQIVADVMRSLEKEQLQQSWTKVKDKGTVLRDAILRSIKKFIPLDEKESADIKSGVLSQTEVLNDLLKSHPKSEDEIEWGGR